MASLRRKKRKVAKRKRVVRRKKPAPRLGLRARPISELPKWAKDHIEYRCKEWYRLSPRAILVICDNRQHVPRDRGVGIKTGVILKLRVSKYLEPRLFWWYTPLKRRWVVSTEVYDSIPRIARARRIRPPLDIFGASTADWLKPAEWGMAYAILY